MADSMTAEDWALGAFFVTVVGLWGWAVVSVLLGCHSLCGLTA